MFSYHLNDFSLKVVLKKNSKKNIAKKWCESYEGGDYQ